jgi:microcystin-dependent protein
MVAVQVALAGHQAMDLVEALVSVHIHRLWAITTEAAVVAERVARVALLKTLAIQQVAVTAAQARQIQLQVHQ